MTLRQRLLKLVYPIWMWWAKSKGKGQKKLSRSATPAVPFYSLETKTNNGDPFSFSDLKGKKIMIVNTASNCGYTNQYSTLEELYGKYKDKLEIIAFPANDFKEQEKGSDTEIAEFCKRNFGITFPIMQKSTVVKGADQNNVFHWLSDASLNGWNEQQPSWNFCKYIINEEGKLTNFFGSSVDPMSSEVLNAIN